MGQTRDSQCRCQMGLASAWPSNQDNVLRILCEAQVRQLLGVSSTRGDSARLIHQTVSSMRRYRSPLLARPNPTVTIAKIPPSIQQVS